MKPLCPIFFRSAACLLFLVSWLSTFHAQAEEGGKIALWEKGKAPDGKGGFADEEATVSVPSSREVERHSSRHLSWRRIWRTCDGAEGDGIAEWLTGHGVAGVVLKYRLPAGRPYVPLLDAQRAILLVRSKAKEWGCDPEKIGIAGFSAGGHLAATAATHFDKHSRPDFTILVYPVITMGEFTHGGSRNRLLGKDPSPEMVKLFSNKLQVTAETPPVFLAHAVDDTVVSIANSRMFHEAIQKHKVPGEFLELPSGNHGLNGYKGPMWDAWQAASLKWLGERGFLPKSAEN